MMLQMARHPIPASTPITKKNLIMKKLLIILPFLFLLTACGGGGGGNSNGNVRPSMPLDPPAIIDLPASSGTYSNPDAVDPLDSFTAVPLPASSQFSYQRDIPENSPSLLITYYTAPGTNLPDNFVPMVNRAAKVWTRRIDGVLTPGGRHTNPHLELGMDDVLFMDFLVGYEQSRCPLETCSNHYGDSLLNPTDRIEADINPAIALTPDFFDIHTLDGELTVNGFRVLAHELGHIFDYGDNANTDMYHADCSGGAIMCDRWKTDVPAIPVEDDFNGIRHHYTLRDDTDYEQFGIWANVPGAASDLNSFGVRVTRTLTVDDGATDIWQQQTIDNFIQDQIFIETEIRGTPSGGPVVATGTATWSGDLIAVDTMYFQPILGDADLTMDLSTVDALEAAFTNLHRTDGDGIAYSVPGLSYTLYPNGGTWVDANSTVAADFYTVDGDNIGAVAGRLNNQVENIMGAFGALRDK